MKTTTLPSGYWWEECTHCGLPTIVSDSGSVNGGGIGHGCPRCLLQIADQRGVRDAITEGTRALHAHAAEYSREKARTPSPVAWCANCSPVNGSHSPTCDRNGRVIVGHDDAQEAMMGRGELERELRDLRPASAPTDEVKKARARLHMMTVDKGDTWDLGPKDKAAIRLVLGSASASPPFVQSADVGRLRDALWAIRAWDILNPGEGRPDMLSDAPWARKLIDEALSPSAGKVSSNPQTDCDHCEGVEGEHVVRNCPGLKPEIEEYEQEDKVINAIARLTGKPGGATYDEVQSMRALLRGRALLRVVLDCPEEVLVAVSTRGFTAEAIDRKWAVELYERLERPSTRPPHEAFLAEATRMFAAARTGPRPGSATHVRIRTDLYQALRGLIVPIEDMLNVSDNEPTLKGEWEALSDAMVHAKTVEQRPTPCAPAADSDSECDCDRFEGGEHTQLCASVAATRRRAARNHTVALTKSPASEVK